MNKLQINIRKESGESAPTTIAVNKEYEPKIIGLICEATSLEIDILKADKMTYKENGLDMIRYTLTLDQDNVDELGDFLERMKLAFELALPKNQN